MLAFEAGGDDEHFVEGDCLLLRLFKFEHSVHVD